MSSFDLRALRPGDFIWHEPTGKSGTVEGIEDRDGHVAVSLNDGEGPYLIGDEEFRLWWGVEVDEIQRKWPEGDVAILKTEGRVVEKNR